MAEIPFPGGAQDGDVFFHEDKVCVYHADINTWECRTIDTDQPAPPNPFDTIYTTDVHTVRPDGLPPLETQFKELLADERDDEIAVPLQSDVNQEFLYTPVQPTA